MSDFTQASLFEEISPSIEKIEGLTYMPDFTTAKQETELIRIINHG